MEKLKVNDLSKISGGVNLQSVGGKGSCWHAECYKCGKDLTNSKGDILAITKQHETYTSYEYACPECADKSKGFKHLFEKYVKSTDPVTGQAEYDWKKVNI